MEVEEFLEVVGADPLRQVGHSRAENSFRSCPLLNLHFQSLYQQEQNLAVTHEEQVHEVAVGLDQAHLFVHFHKDSQHPVDMEAYHNMDSCIHTLAVHTLDTNCMVVDTADSFATWASNSAPCLPWPGTVSYSAMGTNKSNFNEVQTTLNE